MMTRVMSTATLLTFVAITCAAMSSTPLAAEPAALRRYNAPLAESSISGVSSGGFMAVQFATAWSSMIKGVGVVAGGPYWCARADAHDVFTYCASYRCMHEGTGIRSQAGPLYRQGRRKGCCRRD